MQSTTSAFDAEKARNPNEPFIILDLYLDGGYGDWHPAGNRQVTIQGSTYPELFTGPVELEFSGEFSPDGGGQPRRANVRISLANEDDVIGTPWSDLLATKTLTNRIAQLWQGFITPAGAPLAFSDHLILLEGSIILSEDLLFTDEEFHLEIRDSSDAWHKEIGTPITETNWPNAPEESIGKINPIIYGYVEKSPCIPVDVGGRSTLSVEMDEAVTTSVLTDASGLPGSGTIRIDQEQITYTGQSGNTVTGLTRGASPIPHQRGAAVVEKQDYYSWRIAGHPIKGVLGVYVREQGGTHDDWISVQSGQYGIASEQGGTNLRLTLESADIFGGFTFITNPLSWGFQLVFGFVAQPFLPNLRDQFTDGQNVPAGTPVNLGDGLTIAFNAPLTCRYFNGAPADWDPDYTLAPTASLELTGISTVTGTFNQSVLAFAVSLKPSGTGTSSMRIDLPDNQLTATFRTGNAAFLGWKGKSFSAVTYTQTAGSPLTDAKLAIQGVLATSPPSVAAVIKRDVDLQVTTSAGSSTVTDTDPPDGESFPQNLGGPGQSVNKTYNFPVHETAIRRIWKVSRGSVTTPSGSIWRYGIGSHLDEWAYPNLPPSEYTFIGEPLATQLVITNTTTNAAITITAVSCEVMYTGTQTPTSTVSGRSLAQTEYNIEVAVDVEGWKDDGAGSYTGTPNALIIRPADILRHLAATYLSWIVGDRFDTATFLAARAAEIAAGIRLDFALQDPIHSAELFERIRHQTMSAHFLSAEGKYKRWVYPFSRTTLKAFTELEDVPPIRVGLTPLRELYNVVGIHFAPTLDGNWAGYVERQSIVSQGLGHPPQPGYNATKRWIAEFDLIRD